MNENAVDNNGSILSRLWDSVVFFSRYFKSPIGLSAPVQSSPKATRAIRDELRRHGARRVVELGSGVGRITTGILEVIPPEERLLCVEREKLFCKRLKKRFGSRVVVVSDDARRLPEILADSDFADPDGIVCSIPFNTTWAGELCRVIAGQLTPGAIYLQLSWTGTPLEPYFDVIRRHAVMTNVLPAYVHVARVKQNVQALQGK